MIRVLPTWDECQTKVDNGKPMTPLEGLIWQLHIGVNKYSRPCVQATLASVLTEETGETWLPETPP